MIKQRRLFIAVAVAAAAAAGAVAWRSPSVAAQAGTQTANMQVSANVLRKCWITAQPLAFANYDPVQVHAAAPLDGQATLSVACTKGTAVNIALDNGSNAQGTTRRMSAGTEFLTYELFKDGGHSLRWGDQGGEVLDGGVAPSKDPRLFTVYGRIAGGQDVPEGNFEDTVLVTVQF